MSARDDLTRHFGYAGDDYWQTLMDRYRAEVLREVAAWLHSAGEPSAAYLLLTNEIPSEEIAS